MFDSILNMRLGIVLKKIIIVSFVNLQDMPWNIFSWCWSFKLKKSRLGKLLQVVSLVMYPTHLVFLQIFCLLILVKCSFCELVESLFSKTEVMVFTFYELLLFHGTKSLYNPGYLVIHLKFQLLQSGTFCNFLKLINDTIPSKICKL